MATGVTENAANRGAMFKNDKQGNEKRPDYTGHLSVTEPGEYRVAAWLRKSAKGDVYMSLALESRDRPTITPVTEEEAPF